MSEDCPGHEITPRPFEWPSWPHDVPVHDLSASLQQTVRRDPIVRGLENILVEIKAIRIAVERMEK